MPIGDDGSVVQRRHMIPHCCASEIAAILPRVPSIRLRFLLFRLFSFVLSPRVHLVLFIRKRVAIAPMPREIADAILHTIPREPRNSDARKRPRARHLQFPKSAFALATLHTICAGITS